MSKRAGALSAGLTILALAGAAMVSLGTSPAQAVVYCKTVGIPKGCVVRPTAAVVVAPAAAVAVATPGVGAPGVGVRAGTPIIAVVRSIASACAEKDERVRAKEHCGRTPVLRRQIIRPVPLSARPTRSERGFSADGGIAVGENLRQLQPHARA